VEGASVNTAAQAERARPRGAERGVCGCTVHKIEYDLDTSHLTLWVSGEPKMQRLRNVFYALFEDAKNFTVVDHRGRVLKNTKIARMSESVKDGLRRRKRELT
jgi:hypothetical protein